MVTMSNFLQGVKMKTTALISSLTLATSLAIGASSTVQAITLNGNFPFAGTGSAVVSSPSSLTISQSQSLTFSNINSIGTLEATFTPLGGTPGTINDLFLPGMQQVSLGSRVAIGTPPPFVLDLTQLTGTRGLLTTPYINFFAFSSNGFDPGNGSPVSGTDPINRFVFSAFQGFKTITPDPHILTFQLEGQVIDTLGTYEPTDAAILFAATQAAGPGSAISLSGTFVTVVSEAPATTPEPTAYFGILALGALGLGTALKRKQK